MARRLNTVRLHDAFLSGMTDVGVASDLPLVIAIDGQSDARGADPDGSKDIGAKIWTLDSITNLQAVVPAQFGSGVLQLGSGCSLANPGACFNNLGSQVANLIRSRGKIHPDRDIVVIINGYNGESIAN